MVTATTFRQGHVDAAGVRTRYREAGQGAPLVHLPAAGAPDPTRAHALLAGHFRVVVLEPPAPRSADALAATLAALGLDPVSLLASAASAAVALELALAAPRRVRALVLEAPTAHGPARDPELERRLPGLATPTLVLVGTRDAAGPAAMGHACKALIPSCHLVFVYEAAHAIGADRPEAFAEVVGDFLERHDAFVISRARTVIHP